MSELAFFIDYSRCIGCQACVQACEECDTHRGRSLIHLETIERRDSVQTAPQVCMHCEDPICAQVVKTIRPDTVFVPYHWPLDRSANNCTIRAIDPISKIPEFKFCAVRVSKASRPAGEIAALEPVAGGIR